MTSRKRLAVAIAVAVIALSLFILGLVVLPDMLVMQVQADGSAGTTMPKLIGLLIPLAISVVFAVMYRAGDGKLKHLLIALVGLAMFGFTFFFNR